MRLGTTSYIVPADILPNVEYLAPLVDDIELVLFEVDDYGTNIPDHATVTRLRELAAAHELTYTVHLPLDLRLADEDDGRSLSKGSKVIEVCRALEPWAYVLHLDGELPMRPYTAAELAGWQERACRALEELAAPAGDPRLLCIENLERWDPACFAPVLERLPVSRCIDVGHFWVQQLDPLGHLEQWLDRCRVVHLHGLGERDHQSLGLQAPALLDPVAARLCADYQGVVTLEVFSEADFHDSVAAWRAALARVGAG